MVQLDSISPDKADRYRIGSSGGASKQSSKSKFSGIGSGGVSLGGGSSQEAEDVSECDEGSIPGSSASSAGGHGTRARVSPEDGVERFVWRVGFKGPENSMLC